MTTRYCPKCKETRSVKDFSRASQRKDGLQLWCNDCMAAYQKEYVAKNKRKVLDTQNEWQKKQYAENPEYREMKKKRAKEWKESLTPMERVWRDREQWLQGQYGLTHEQVRVMREAQGDGCAICGKNKRLQVDHDHETGRIRGLLCGPCNRALGRFGDTIEGLMRAVAYLQRHHDLLQKEQENGS